MNDAGINDPLDASIPDIIDAAAPIRKDARLERLARQLGSELSYLQVGRETQYQQTLKQELHRPVALLLDPANFCEVLVLSAHAD